MADAGNPSFSRFVAVCTVVTTLAGGLVGYCQATASRSGDVATNEAARLSVRASAERERRLHLAYAVYDRFALLQQERVRLARLAQRTLGLPGQEPAPAALTTTLRTHAQATAGVRRSVSALAREHDLPDLVRQARFTPHGDPFFPHRFLSTAERRGVELSALQDAAEEEASGWGADQASYLGALTLFAVALYLFGFALTPHAHLPRLFVGAGLVLLVTGSAWAAVTRATDPTRAPRAAAAAFADGHLAFNTAYAREDYQRAVEHFTRAIELRPSFARAYVERSSAAFSAGSPQRLGAPSLSEPAARRQAIDDLVKARELGTYSPGDLSSLGFYWFADGVLTGDEDLVRRSQAVGREAISSASERGEDTDPMLHFNLGVSLLAGGRISEAQAEYRTGIGLMSDDFVSNTSIVAGALTDLDLVEQHGGERAAAEARRQKGAVMARLSVGGSDDTASRKALDVDVKAGPGGLQLRKGTGYSSLCSRGVVAVWYTAAPALGWYAEPSSIFRDFRQCIPGLRSSAAESYVSTSYPRSCLPDGRYRLELYDGHAVVARRRVTVRFRSARALDALDLGITMCRPAGWKRWPGGRYGLSAGVVSPDGERGALAMRLSHKVERVDRLRALDTLLRRYAPRVGAAVADPGTPAGHGFMDIPSPTTRRYLAGDKEILAGIGNDRDGTVVVGIVFGPRQWFDTDTPGGLFEAMTLAYQPIA
jgi:tetratricopeptide (TPR) repeat protein